MAARVGLMPTEHWPWYSGDVIDRDYCSFLNCKWKHATWRIYESGCI